VERVERGAERGVLGRQSMTKAIEDVPVVRRHALSHLVRACMEANDVRGDAARDGGIDDGGDEAGILLFFGEDLEATKRGGERLEPFFGLARGIGETNERGAEQTSETLATLRVATHPEQVLSDARRDVDDRLGDV